MTRPRVRKLDDSTSARVAAELDANIDDRSQTVVVGEGQSIAKRVRVSRDRVASDANAATAIKDM